MNRIFITATAVAALLFAMSAEGVADALQTYGSPVLNAFVIAHIDRADMLAGCF